MGKIERVIYLLLTDTGTIFTRAIKWFTHAPYNHVSIVFDNNLQEIYSFGRKNPRNPLIAGFVREDVYSGTYRYFQNTNCTLLKFHVSEEEFMRIRAIIKYFEENQEKFSYNLLGLFGILFRYPIKTKNAYFCSQFVAEVLQKSGIHLWDLPPALVTPNDFFAHHSFQIIYEGKLYDYPLLLEEKINHDIPKRHLSLFELITRIKSLLPLSYNK